jgi:hypothetical protein
MSLEGDQRDQTGAIRSVTLTGEAEKSYLQRMLGTIRAARLNDQYCEARRLGAHMRAMSPEVHRGLYDGLQINLESGLPTYREWTRVQTDVSIAVEQLKQLGERRALAQRAAESDHEIHQQRLDRYDYFDEIADVRLAPLGAMDVALRRVDASRQEAAFFINFDKLDVTGVFVRFRIALTQRNQVWSSSAVRLDEDTASYTDEFKSMIYRFSSLDAEFTLTKLATLPGVDVQRLSRGTVGPVYFGGDFLEGQEVPEPFADLVGDDPTKFVALFGLEQAASDINESRNNDPVGGLFEAEISRAMRANYARARETMGYRVFKDRKFVVSRGLEGPLREICSAMNTQNIIYSI